MDEMAFWGFEYMDILASNLSFLNKLLNRPLYTEKLRKHGRFVITQQELDNSLKFDILYSENEQYEG